MTGLMSTMTMEPTTMHMPTPTSAATSYLRGSLSQFGDEPFHLPPPPRELGGLAFGM